MIRIEAPAVVLQAARAECLRSGSAAHGFERELATRFGVVPIFGDFMGWWAWRLDGTLVFLADEPGAEFELVEDDPAVNHGIHAALILAGQRYPGLRPYCSQRPADALPCPDCDGHGRLAGWPAELLCQCAGAGWVPASGGEDPASDH